MTCAGSFLGDQQFRLIGCAGSVLLKLGLLRRRVACDGDSVLIVRIQGHLATSRLADCMERFLLQCLLHLTLLLQAHSFYSCLHLLKTIVEG